MIKQQAIFCILIMIICAAFFSCEAMATLFHGEKPEPPPVTYTVTFDANGASGTLPAPQTVETGTVITLPEKGDLAKAGSIFVGWSENPNGNGTVLSAGVTVIITQKIIFYAQWLAQYNVTFNANGANGIPPAEQTVTSGTVISLPDGGGLSKGTDIFAGWNESSNGGGTTYSVGASVTVTRNMIFYAQWLDGSTPQYTVTFNANGATGGAAPAPQTVYSGISITLPAQGTLAYSGKTFGGWNTQANGMGTNYAVGATFAVTGNVTLYAKWQSKVQYTVTYQANGASGTVPAAQTVDPGTVIILPGEGNMINSGKVFDGWNTQANGNGTSYAEGLSYTVNANITLYAKWINIPINVPGATLADKLTWLESNAESYNTYNITLDYDEGIGPKTLSYSNRSNITLCMRNTVMRTVSLSSYGALFTVGSGVTLILDSNITLQGRSTNGSSLVRINSNGTLIMNTGTKITGNTIYVSSASVAGGGVYVNGGTFTMNGGEISGNTATSYNSSLFYSYGGGVYVASGTFTMNGGEISGNTVKADISPYGGGYGGGIYVRNGTLTKNGGTIYGSNGDGKSNTVKNTSGTLQENRGHAVYANSSPAKKMENTAEPEIYLFFSYNNGSPFWTGGWE